MLLALRRAGLLSLNKLFGVTFAEEAWCDDATEAGLGAGLAGASGVVNITAGLREGFLETCLLRNVLVVFNEED